MTHIHLFLRPRTPGSTIRQCRCGLNRMGTLRWQEPDWQDIKRKISAVVRERAVAGVASGGQPLTAEAVFAQPARSEPDPGSTSGDWPDYAESTR